jgi:Transposase IS4
LIKKRRYWPKNIKGDMIKEHFEHKPVGYVDSLHGKLSSVDFHVTCMKEEDYVMMLMTTYGSEILLGDEKPRTIGPNREKKKIRYPEVVHNHYQYRDSVDAHNARRQAPIALEETWDTKRWATRVFTFFLALSEVNANLGEEAFGDLPKALPMLEFRRKLSKALINNHYEALEVASTPDKKRKARATPSSPAHKLIRLPPYKKFSGTNVARADSKYPCNQCFCRSKRVRTYCPCKPGTLFCSECFAQHCVEA